MRYVLENELLHVEIDSFGAELKAVRSKTTGQDYMWYGDKKYWGRTSPVLFPFVGSMKNKQYTWQGKTYPMGQHGFARDMEHTMMEKTKDSISFQLTSTPETMAKFPFPFILNISYKLEGTTVNVYWKVTNPAETPLYFSIGAHPAFLCPIHGENSKAGYRLWFEGVNEIHHHGNDVPTGLSISEDICLPLEDGRCTITPEFFDRCTYMIEGKQTGAVGIEDPEGRRFVTVRFNTPLFAIWSPEGKNAPFLCIEPWFGRCDAVDFNGTLEERAYGNTLEAGEVFTNCYTMIFA